MRPRRYAWAPALVAVAVVAAGGLGFAAFSAQATLNGASGSAGTLILWFTAVSLNPSSPSYVQFTSGPTGLNSPNVDLAVGPIGPGDVVTFNFTAKNVGTLNIVNPTLSYTTPSVTNVCDGTFITGTVNVPGSPTSLAAGASFSGTFSIVESLSAPAMCEGTTATFTFSVSGST